MRMFKRDYITTSEGKFGLLEDARENKRNVIPTSTWSVKAEWIPDGQESGRICFLKYTYNSDEQGVKYLKRESEFKMYYPYIEQIYGEFNGWDMDGDSLYGVYAEYIEGNSLENYRNRYKVMDTQAECEMFAQILQLLYGVRYYSKLIKDDPYVHRDLKPQNIMIADADKRVVIIDFDWAHIHESRTTMREGAEGYALGGTRGYMDPRAARSSKTDIKMDIYSLGRIFCFWLIGKDYFSESEKDIYYEVQHDSLAYGLEGSRFPPEYSDIKYQPFMEIIRRMVAPVEKRYKDIDVIITDIKKFLINHYGGPQTYQKIFSGDVLLEIPMGRYQNKDNIVHFVYFKSTEKKGTVKTLENYRMHDIHIEGQLIMAVYNLEGVLYYIPYVSEVTKIGGSKNYEIANGDIFNFRHSMLEFMI